MNITVGPLRRMIVHGGFMACACLLSAQVFVCVPAAVADVQLPQVFGDHMVLQREMAIPVWGTATAGEKVSVSLGSSTAQATADENGQWKVSLDKQSAGGPHQLVVAGKNKVTLSDVYVGEVWVCSGQSNMQWSVRQSSNADEEISAARHPKIRLFTVQRKAADKPQSDCSGRWEVCSPQTVPGFSAVAYYFGRYLHQQLDVPVGLLNTSWGGTRCEAWTSHEALQADADFQPILDRISTTDATQHRAAHLYNAMIAPLVPYAIRGSIWYQGESNVGRAQQYGKLFPTMIRDWRTAWDQGPFPFLFVQLAPFRYNGQDQRNCAELWESQFKTLKLENTGMAVTTDIGNVRDIHPKNKQDVGKRLALWALAKTYGKDLVYSGPLYKGMKIEGDRVRLLFDHVGGGLKSRDGEPLDGFTIAGKDQQFLPAEASIEGNEIVVRSEAIREPAAVRFAWYDAAQPNLCNNEGLPASPFRTDEWQAVTAGNL